MSSLEDRFAGVFTALVTPFGDDENIDRSAFESLLQTQLDAGIAGLVPVGTTGEAATLSEDERDFVIQTTVETTDGNAFVLAGTGSNDTRKAVFWTKKAETLNCDGCLVVTPYYNKPSQEGLIHYYGEVAACTKLPIILYSVPSRCGVEIKTETAARLNDSYPNIVGIKEAGGSAERVTELRRLCGPGFIIHSGDDGLTLPFLAAGAIGVTSVLSNLEPRLMDALVAAWRRSDLKLAQQLHEQVHQLANVMFIESNPAPIKYALSDRGLMREFVRSPLAPLSQSNAHALRDVLRHHQTMHAAQ